ncbi:hypothetical protein E4U53_005264 [Claviceps sorghi]|nr:hypothetical protein E4U53_005264 [Claviceps sorghi]
MSTLKRFVVAGSRILTLTVVFSMVASPVNCLGWRNTWQAKGKSPGEHGLTSPASLVNTDAGANAYSMAFMELQELESEPLCHKIAARLLVGNCRLLDGQNEATVFTNTERASRDFVDFFAASLAICDLERANFDIPAPCYKFRETVLANLPAPSKPQLHVTTAEIGKCLEGLSTSASSWNTWVSYKHKALRFCEAARVENEKDQHIMLHKKLAIILDRLTRQAENETQGHARSLERIFQKSNENAEVMTDYMKNFETLALRLNNIVGGALSDSTRTQVAIQNSMQGVRALDDFMEALLSRWTMREKEMSREYEVALKTATEVATQDVVEIAKVLRAISINSVSLQAQLKKSGDQQEAMQKTMENQQVISNVVLEKLFTQDKMLESTQKQMSIIRRDLEEATMTASTLHGSLLEVGAGAWLPYILCPIATLGFASYKLEPSLVRNLALMVLSKKHAVSDLIDELLIDCFAGEVGVYAWSYMSAPQNHEAASRLASSFIPWKNWHSSHVSAGVDNSTCYSATVFAGSDMETCDYSIGTS